MNLTLIRSMTRSAVFELENGLCFRPAHPFTVALNGKTVYEACNTNVFSLFSLLPGTDYTVERAGRGRDPEAWTFRHRGRELLCGCIPLRSGGRRRDRQHRQAAGRSVHLPQGRHGVCARRPLPHRQPVHEEQHHPVSGKGRRAAGRQRPHPLPHPARRHCPARTRWTSTT